MRELMKMMRQQLAAGEDLALVTVVASHGATPRGAGARMIVSRKGRLYGTIGGGAVEYRSEQMAAKVLEDKSSMEHEFTLTKDDIEKLGMICGGDVTVQFLYIPGGDQDVMDLADQVEHGFEHAEDLWLVSDIGNGGALSLARPGDPHLGSYLTRHPSRVKENGLNLYVEQITTSGRVYIFGGGHVAQELEPVLTHVGFRCTVMDDRDEFTKPELFPTADQVLHIDFTRILDFITITENDYVCVMTRGHAFDTVVQAQVLPCHPAYVGVIGSKHKAAGVRRTLKEQYGISEADLDQVITPIGTEILAETPAEIAISIAGEMICHRAKLNQK